MTNPLKDLHQLTELAHQRDDESRLALLEHVTDLFMASPDSHTSLQNECFGDIMMTLAYALEQEVREELACRIAEEAGAPRLLVLRLANDVISVARPVLEKSPALTECDLIGLARARSQDHLFAITRRVDIRVRLSAVLCERGDDHVVECLLKNESADIASDTLQRVADRAKGSTILQSALISRGDVPKIVILDLIDHVSEKLKHQLLHRLTDADKTNLDVVIAAFKAQAKAAEASAVELEIRELADSGKLNQYVLMRFVSRGKYQHFLLGLSRVASIGVPACLKILGDDTGTALAVVCRANGFGAKTLKRIAMSPLTGIPTDLKRVRDLVTMYNRLSLDNARAAMSHWRARKDGLPVVPEGSAPRLPRGRPAPPVLASASA